MITLTKFILCELSKELCLPDAISLSGTCKEIFRKTRKEKVPYLKNCKFINLILNGGLLPSSSKKGKTMIIKMLIEAGVDVNIKGDDGYTALIRATRRGNIDCMKILLENGADINMKDIANSWTPLHFAAYKNNLKCIEFLLKFRGKKGYEADINIQNDYGSTPLMTATIFQNRESVELLLEKNANPNILNFENQNALNLAVHNSDIDCTKLLIMCGKTKDIRKQYYLYAVDLSKKVVTPFTRNFITDLGIFSENFVS